MNNQVVLILPYFGELPNYFDLWLRSASYNKGFVDFLLFTDCDMQSYDIPENVYVIPYTLDKVRSRTNEIMPFKHVIHNAYKLCDYKPLYGMIFAEYISKYQFWGHCDPDIIWGDLKKFITASVLKKYDRIYSHGHLCIYRNIERINSAIFDDYNKYHNLKKTGITIKDIYSHTYITHFDESEALTKLLAQSQIDAVQYDSPDFADIETGKKEFECIDAINKRRIKNSYFIWDNGKLYGVEYDSNKREYAYIHLQKRKMDIDMEQNQKSFLIIPNAFIDVNEISDEDIEKWKTPDKKYEDNFLKWCKKSKVEHVLQGALIFRMKKLIAKIRRKWIEKL